MNFRQILATTRDYNFHSHTQFCDGKDTLEAIAASAAAMGFKFLGFTPHSPMPIPSPANMLAESVPLYLAEVKRVQNILGDACQLYTGMEIDYLGSQWGAALPYFTDLGLDFAISSVHFIPNQKGVFIDIDGKFERFKAYMATHFDNDIEYVVKTFYEQSHKMLDDGHFDILGHFDKIAHNSGCFHPGIEEEQWYCDLVDEYIDHIIASGVIVEINTKAYAPYGIFFPNPRYWKRLIDAGVTIMVNSDVHKADLVNASRPEAFAILDTLGYES